MIHASKIKPIKEKSFNSRANKVLLEEIVTQLEKERNLRQKDQKIIELLLKCLEENGIQPPNYDNNEENIPTIISPLLQDGSTKSLGKLLDSRANFRSERSPMSIHYNNLGYWTMLSDQNIPTVASAAKRIIFGSGPQHRVDILHSMTGRVRPASMTLLMGPPGSGKSTLLKALSGRIHLDSKNHLDGTITYNGQTEKDGNFILAKLVSYVDELDEHIPLLTVKETLEFAWSVTTGGHHSYLVSDDPIIATALNKDDKLLARVWNIATILGVKERMNTVVGDHMIRGVSGGEKRRVSIGEMLVPQGRCLSFMDAVSNGLDASTTFDIMAVLRVAVKTLKITNITSLLQPSPEVFNLFDDIILISDGYVIYHGTREDIIPYFEELGYYCPKNIDTADFLQDIATLEGIKFIKIPQEYSTESISINHHKNHHKDYELNHENNSKNDDENNNDNNDIDNNDNNDNNLIEGIELINMKKKLNQIKKFNIPIGSKQLAEAWKNSKLYQNMLNEMENELKQFQSEATKFSPKYLERYPGSLFFYFQHLWQRQLKLTFRDGVLVKARIMRYLILGAVTSSLFHDLKVEDVHTMSGFIFYSTLTLGVGNLTLIPTLYLQKNIFYKQYQSLFYPSSVFVLVQTIALIPFQLIDIFIFCSMTYWSVGLSSDENGIKFLLYLAIMFTYYINFAQFIRLVCSVVSTESLASPTVGILLMLMVLVCGYVIPKNNIPNWLIWLYWSNPFSWAMKALTINEYSSSDYDFLLCYNTNCTQSERFGNVVLKERGNPTNTEWIYYTLIFLVAQFILWVGLTILVLTYVKPFRTPKLSSHPNDNNDNIEDNNNNLDNNNDNNDNESGLNSFQHTRIKNEDEAEDEDNNNNNNVIEIPFDPVTLAFKDIWYTVTLKGGEELDLLKGVSGYAEPGTMTALMGSSGAGKTTLLDVLSDRKTTGEIKGLICINGKILDKKSFRRVSGYVEQFDTLPIQSTAFEAIEFSASLRLSPLIDIKTRNLWINSVISTLELTSIQHNLIGTSSSGGMSFEQRKRVSIGLELVANPSLLFLDEPTTGLDSRGAQIVIRCMQRVASTGRTIIATIHQPSISLFSSFNFLYLLRRGGETVYFGSLGENSKDLVHYFSQIPGVEPLTSNKNPATWMLECIGAGTSNQSSSITDFHQYYNRSVLCLKNEEYVKLLCDPVLAALANEDDEDLPTDTCLPVLSPLISFRSPFSSIGVINNNGNNNGEDDEDNNGQSNEIIDINSYDSSSYRVGYYEQFILLFKRAITFYWRTPGYNFVRMIISLIVAFVFGLTCSEKNYATDIEVVSSASVIYMTLLFLGVIQMNTVQPVAFAERPIFYREQDCDMYHVLLYSIAYSLVEIPYLIISSLLFLIPFFFLMDFSDNFVLEKFFWFWLFQTLYMSSLVYCGQFMAAYFSSSSVAGIFGGLISTSFSLFAGFLIKYETLPSFWTFMYWLNPLHYAIEGILMTQYYSDHHMILITETNEVMSLSNFLAEFFPSWSFSNRIFDIIALVIIIVALKFGTYLCLRYMRHQKR